MAEANRAYLPAASVDWALPFYDPLVKLLGLESTRQKLVDQAALLPGYRVIEIGCGTGSVVLALKRVHADVDVIGFDPDQKALARARWKAERAGVAIQFDCGFAEEMPFPDASFDRVLSSFMFHHLEHHTQERALREVRRILKPSGSLHLVDFAHRPSQGDRMLTLMKRAGFRDSTRVVEEARLFGQMRIRYYRAAASTRPSTLEAGFYDASAWLDHRVLDGAACGIYGLLKARAYESGVKPTST